MILADNAKHNANGRIDETGMIQHRDTELCPIGALAMHLFFIYHVSPDSHKPDFEPDFSDTAKGEGFGLYGKRDWYRLKLFRKLASEPYDSMSYQSG
jgi:hypothetical protein